LVADGAEVSPALLSFEREKIVFTLHLSYDYCSGQVTSLIHAFGSCRTQTCRFSGLKIYPGRGMLFIRVDGQQFLFLKQKCRALFNQRKRPAKLAWTTTYRRQHRKDQEQQVARKKRRSSARVVTRAVAGASVEVIAKKKAEKPEQRKASREAALRQIKERSKKAKAERASAHRRN